MQERCLLNAGEDHMLKGTCHCGAAHWTLEGDPGPVTARDPLFVSVHDTTTWSPGRSVDVFDVTPDTCRSG